MSQLSDALSFEGFNRKDIWRKIKKNPARLLYGGVDPWSTKMWNSILGKNDEPLIDQMGGPYGGSTFSMFGDNTGGVYGRANDAGINTTPARGIHDVAHVVAGLYAGNYGAGKLGGLGGESGGAKGGTGWQDYASMVPNQQATGPDPYEEERKRQEEEARKRRAAMVALSVKLSGNQGIA